MILGFIPGHAICSYLYDKIAVDIMPTENSPIGPCNQWNGIGMKDLWQIQVMGINIQILSVPCYLATKFEEFNNRGSDYRTSHDFEDIIYILNNRTTMWKRLKIPIT